jgi:hypothetical protein
MVTQVRENREVRGRSEMMHPDYRMELLREDKHRLEQALRRMRLLEAPTPRPSIPEESVVLRLCSVHDDDALARLALLEGRPEPRGRYVLAEVDGEIVAAVPLRGGEPLSDPFRPTAHLLPLLRLRAAQLEAQPRPRIETAKAIAARMLHPAR